MPHPSELCPPPHLPPPQFLPSPPHPFSNTCHPLSITKTPLPPRCPQAATALPCHPLLQKCVLLCPEPRDTSVLLPAVPRALPATQSRAGDKKRVARSLPPCAPRCPEPERLRFPPCGIRCSSSSSCRGHCRSHKVAKCAWRWPEMTSGYSLPLRGVTECPPQQGVGHSLVQEYLHRCSKGYPTQEFVTCACGEQRLGNVTVTSGVTKECHPLREVAKGAREVAKVTKECHPLREVAKGAREVVKVTKECPPLREVTKEVAKGTREVAKGTREVAKGSPLLLEGLKSCSSPHLSRSRCGQHRPRGSPRPSRLVPAPAKRSGHPKKSRSASRWLW